MLDECQTGLGRLGALYGFELYDFVPDFLVLSKTLGGGVPISAVVTSAEIERTCFERGLTHVTSHVSDPMPAAAALAVLAVVEEESLAAAARDRGAQLLARLGELQERHEAIGDVRGMGLLTAIELVEDRDSRRPALALGADFTDECERCGLSVNLVRGRAGGAAQLRPDGAAADDLRERGRPGGRDHGRGADDRRRAAGARRVIPIVIGHARLPDDRGPERRHVGSVARPGDHRRGLRLRGPLPL